MAQTEKRTLEIVTKVTDRATSVMGRISGAMVRSVTRIVRAFSALSGIGAALAGFFSARAFIDGVLSASERLDALAKSARNLGTSIEGLASFQFAAERSGTSIERATKAYANFQKVSGQASLGMGEAARAFQLLGLRVEDVPFDRPIEALALINERLAELNNQATEAAVRQQLFGEAAAGASDLFKLSADDLQALQARYTDLLGGADLERAAAGAEELQDSLTDVTTAVEGLAARFLSDLGPVLADAARKAADFISELDERTIKLFTQGLIAVGEVLLVIGSLLFDLIRILTLAAQSFGLVSIIYQEELGKIVEFTSQVSTSAAEAAQRLAELRVQVGQTRTRSPLVGGGEGDGARGPGDEAVDNMQRFNLALAQAADLFTNVDAAAANFVSTMSSTVFTGFSNAIASAVIGAQSLKDAFVQFGKLALQTLAQVIVQLLIVRTLSAVFGGLVGGPAGVAVSAAASGGVMKGGLGGLREIPGYASGGIVTKPHIGIVGEGRHNEAIVPLPDGRRIPVEMRGGGSAQVSFHFDGPTDGESVRRMLVRERGTIRAIIEDAMTRSRPHRSRMREVVA